VPSTTSNSTHLDDESDATDADGEHPDAVQYIFTGIAAVISFRYIHPYTINKVVNIAVLQVLQYIYIY